MSQKNVYTNFSLKSKKDILSHPVISKQPHKIVKTYEIPCVCGLSSSRQEGCEKVDFFTKKFAPYGSFPRTTI